MEALAWISDFVRTCAQVFPRLILIRATHRGVLFKRSKAKALNAGIHFYWPVWSEVSIMPVVRQTINLFAQSLITSDRKSISLSVVVVYEIRDIERALCKTYDFEHTIMDCAQGAVKRLVTKRTFDQLVEDDGTIDKELTKLVASALRQFGVHVRRAFLSDLTLSRAIRFFNDGPVRT